MLLEAIIEGVTMGARIVARDFVCWLIYKRWGHTPVYIALSGLMVLAAFAFIIYLTVRHWTSG
jgi:hypothetical protein